jgi:hypothetical protein
MTLRHGDPSIARPGVALSSGPRSKPVTSARSSGRVVFWLVFWLAVIGAFALGFWLLGWLHGLSTPQSRVVVVESALPGPILKLRRKRRPMREGYTGTRRRRRVTPRIRVGISRQSNSFAL